MIYPPSFLCVVSVVLGVPLKKGDAHKFEFSAFVEIVLLRTDFQFQ